LARQLEARIDVVEPLLGVCIDKNADHLQIGSK
jgi:hypothetical protein